MNCISRIKIEKRIVLNTDNELRESMGVDKIAVSLFSSSGVGDLGLKANSIKTVIGCELLKERSELFSNNYPDAKMFQGDIWELKTDIIKYYQNHFSTSPYLILATPPCQGMSSNGMGTMLSNIRKGIRPKEDSRNLLIIPALDIIEALQPEWIIFENVENMVNTAIVVDDEVVNIIDYIKNRLGPKYVGGPNVIDCADYGVPQHRKRLLTIFSRSERGRKYFEQSLTFMPNPDHSKNGLDKTKKWVTLRDVIADTEPLEAVPGKNKSKQTPLHRVPLLDDKKMFWVKNTPEGQTAFSNQCVNPSCMYQGNPIHGCKRNNEGINQSKKDTPIYCVKCGSLLPRPSVEKDGSIRLMNGFTSAYKRMSWDEPASTLTQNFQYACSDNKLHPSQNRVLSLQEGLIIQTISNYEYSFEINGRLVKEGLIRDTIGESVPPLIIDKICAHIGDIEEGNCEYGEGGDGREEV